MTILTKQQQDLAVKLFNDKDLAPFNLKAGFDFTNLVHSAVINICVKSDPEYPFILVGIDFRKVTGNPYVSGVRFDHRFTDISKDELLFLWKLIGTLNYKFSNM